MNLAPPIRWVQPSREPTAAPEAARPGEWSELPTIERATGEHELTARSQVFVGGLVSRRPARATRASLRGGRSLEGPHGLVRGIARALDGGRRDGPELAPAPPARARRRSAALAGQSTAASAPSFATEQEMDAEPESAPTDIGLGAADLPDPRPRVVQAVTRFGGPGAGEAPALTRAAEGAPNPPAGRMSRAPLALDRAEAQVTEADTSAVVASAPHATSSAEPSPAPPLSEFLPRRLRGRSAPQPALVERKAEPEPGPGPGPEPATTTESDVEARTVDGEPPRDSGISEPLHVTSVVTAARSFAARPERSADEASSGLTADAVPPAPADTSARAASGPAPMPVIATPAPAISGSATRDSSAAPDPETEVHAAPVEAAAVTSRSGDAAVAASPEEHVSFEPSPERADPAAPAQPRPPESPTGGGEATTTPAHQVSRAAEVQRRATAPRERGAVKVPAAVRGMRAAAPDVQRHETPAAAQTYEPTASEALTATRAVPAEKAVDARVAASGPEARADSGAHAVPEPATRQSLPARRAATAAVQREAMTPHESEAATPHEPAAPEARSDTREPVARPRVAESPLPTPEIRAHARPSTAAGVQRQAAPQLPEHDETRAHTQPSTAAGRQWRATAQPREPIAPEARSDTREPITRARAAESPPPALEAKPRAEPATAAKVRRQATAQPREPAAPETTAEPPEAVTRTRAVESPPAPEAQPHAQATTAAQIRRQATAQPRERAAPATAAEPPGAVTRARAVESPPPAQRTRPPAQASPGADVHRQATEQRHEHVAAEASTEAREPVVPSTVADAPVPASEARTHGNADSTSEASQPRRAPASPPATGADVRRRAKTPPGQPHRQDAVDVDVPAHTRESIVQARSADASAAELTVSPEPEPSARTRPAPAAEDRDERPDATQREAPVPSRRPGFDLHALLSASSISRSSAAPAESIQRIAQAHGAELTEGAARLPGLGVQRTRSAQRSEAAIAFPRTTAEQTPRAALQLVPSLTPVAQAAPAAHLPAPAMPVALPAPPDPPATVQRIKSVADPESTARERVSEASDDELEVLADRLYDRIRTRFRSELLIDRERAGLLADRY